MKIEKRRINKLILVITLRCNLRCKYCYVKKKNQTISKENAKKAVDLLMKTEGNKKIIEFFGGEPLLETKLVIDLINYARKVSKDNNKEIKFLIETNGTKISNNLIKTINKKDTYLSISYDGSNNDTNRIYKNNNNNNKTSKVIEENISKLKKNKNIWNNLTIIITTNGKDLTKSIKNLYKNDIKKLKINLLTKLMDKKDIDNLKEELKKIEKFCKETKDLIIKKTNIMSKKEFLNKKNIPCGITEQIMIMPDGRILPCKPFINSKNKLHELGNISNNIIKNEFFYDNKLDSNIPFCVYFDKNGKALNSKELNSYIKEEIYISSKLNKKD